MKIKSLQGQNVNKDFLKTVVLYCWLLTFTYNKTTADAGVNFV